MTTEILTSYPIEHWIGKRGFTIPEFAEAVSVSRQAVYLWIHGGKVTDRRKKVICGVLNVQPSQVAWPGSDNEQV